MMRVVFMGNHSVGVWALTSLCDSSDVVGVVAHPPDPEDGVRYESVYACAKRLGIPAKRLKPPDAKLVRFVESTKPDLIWLTDYRYVVPGEIIDLAHLGTVNLHPSLLPKYRGRAPLNWAIINGETRLGLTAHFVSDRIDAGDIIAQEHFELGPNEDVGHALDKLNPIYATMTDQVVRAFIEGRLRRTPQPSGSHRVYPPRRPEDGRIDWQQSAVVIGNLVRAVARPYPGAFGFVKGTRVTIWKCAVGPGGNGAAPGTTLEANSGGFKVACGRGTLSVLDWSVESCGRAGELNVDDRFETEDAPVMHADEE